MFYVVQNICYWINVRAQLMSVSRFFNALYIGDNLSKQLCPKILLNMYAVMS